MGEWVPVHENKPMKVPAKTTTTTVTHTSKETIDTFAVLQVVLSLGGALGFVNVKNKETIEKEETTTTTVVEGEHTVIVTNTFYVEKDVPAKTAKPKVKQFFSLGPSDGAVREGSLGPVPPGIRVLTSELDFGNGQQLTLTARAVTGAEIREMLQSDEAIRWFDPALMSEGLFYCTEFELPIEHVDFRPIPVGEERALRISQLEGDLHTALEEISNLHGLVERSARLGISAYAAEVVAARTLHKVRVLSAELNALTLISREPGVG